MRKIIDLGGENVALIHELIYEESQISQEKSGASAV